MKPNPVLRRLGLDDHDRAVILHIDDAGSAQCVLPAVIDLLDFGLVTSAAVMVPCAWFPQTATYCREHPSVDMGVHLTLNSEWSTCRWAPISTQDRTTGLIDDEGYFHRRHNGLYAAATPEAGKAEMRAQIERALAAGVDVTHIDSHMGAIGHPLFAESYIELALEYRLPPSILLRAQRFGFTEWEHFPNAGRHISETVERLEEMGVPLLDDVMGLPLDTPEERVAQAKAELDARQPGTITHFFLHPAHDTPELRTMCPDWPSRVADYHAFLSPELRDHIHNTGIQLISNTVLRDLMRQSMS
jgi:predicted glycoside hydrolase/deacetylase ChbG (UPF0249 family)